MILGVVAIGKLPPILECISGKVFLASLQPSSCVECGIMLAGALHPAGLQPGFTVARQTHLSRPSVDN